MKSVTCFGGLHFDVKAQLSEPMKAGTSNPVRSARMVGGVATNVARSLARLGVPVSLVSVVGEDADLLRRSVEEEGVDVSAVSVVDGAATATYTALIEPDGSLAAGIADMGIYDHMTTEWGLQAPNRGDLWFADTNVAAEGLAALADAAASRPLFVDPVSVSKAVRALPVLARLEGIFPDAAEARVLTGESDPGDAALALVAAGVGHAMVTVGSAGVVEADRSGVVRRGAIAPERVLDVTGAGDAFVAGYLAALALEGDDPVGWGLAAASLALETLETVPTDLGLAALLARL